MAQSFVNLMILIDDANRDETVAIAKAMNQVKVHICERNLKAYLFTLVMVSSTREVRNRKMSVETNTRSDEKVWTRGRIVSVAASLAVILPLAIVSYHIGDLVPVATATTPEPVNANASAPAPAPAAPPELVDLPPAVSVVPLKDVKGGSFKLADFFGKVAVINLWATWCGPCRREIPELVKLNKEFHSRGVEMIGLSTENPEASAEKVRKFIQDFQIDYRIGWAPAEVGVPLMQGHEAIPQIFVISRDGRILKRFLGYSAAYSTQLKQVLEDALK
jgi:thiol-disulfide isomerase/thioredoxin